MDITRPIVRSALRRAARPSTTPSSQRQARWLQSSSRRAATPLPHGTIPGPPPPAPAAAEPSPEDAIARKKRNAELLARGQAMKVNPSRPATALQKRFWKQTSVQENEDSLQVMLDTRPVRSGTKDILKLPKSKHHLATSIALEWDQLVSAQQALKHYYIPMTSIASRANDIQRADSEGITKTREDIIKMCMRYLETDTSLCWAGDQTVHEKMRNKDGETLREKQKRVADVIIGYMTTHVWPGVEIIPVLAADSIMPASQSDMTKNVIRGWISGLPAFELAGFERAVLAGKSLLVAARLIVEWSQEFADIRKSAAGIPRFGIEEAAEATSLEVRWQTDVWGEVEDTHDVEREDVRRQFGQVILLVDGRA